MSIMNNTMDMFDSMFAQKRIYTEVFFLNKRIEGNNYVLTLPSILNKSITVSVSISMCCETRVKEGFVEIEQCHYVEALQLTKLKGYLDEPVVSDC
jgi:hypothetical protein